MREAVTGLFSGLGVRRPGGADMKWQQFQRWGMHLLEYGSSRQVLRAAVKTAAGVGVVAAGGIALTLGIRRLRDKDA